jgi:hypothetical protein
MDGVGERSNNEMKEGRKEGKKEASDRWDGGGTVVGCKALLQQVVLFRW